MSNSKQINEELLQNMKREAIERLRELKLSKDVRNAFEKDGIVMCSYNRCIRNLKESELKLIRKWEREHETLAYHVVYSESIYGAMLTIPYISNRQDEWELDREDLREEEKWLYCYVINLDNLLCSEYGYCCFSIEKGGLVREA